MAIVAFDGLVFVKTIEAAGFSRDQAEAIAKAVSILHIEPNGFATREDVLQHEKEIALIQRDIAEIKATMATKADLRDLESRMTIRLGSMIMALGGVLIAIKFMG
jgi:hypothetical protein